MPWFPEIAGSAFWDTIQLCRSVTERQQLPKAPLLQVLEPSIAEFIAALAAGNNAHHILQIGCGISTIALAAAARATGSFVLSIHFDKDKQEAVNDHVKYLGLVEYVKFMTDEPKNVLPLHEGVDFAFLSENSECYIELFDLLRLKNGAIIVADNALDEAVNEYIKHVRRQPGVRSSTLPLGRGIEVTKILSWNEFRSGRLLYCESGKDIDKINGCCKYEDMILSDGTLPCSGSKSNYSSNNCLLSDSDQCGECDTEKNSLEDAIISAPPCQIVNDSKETMDGGYLEEVGRETDCSYTCPLSTEGECSVRSHGVKCPQTDEQLMYINEKEACHMCYVSHASPLSFPEDSMLSKKIGGILDKELPTNGFFAGARLAESTSSEALPRYLAEDPKDVSVVEHPKCTERQNFHIRRVYRRCFLCHRF